MITKQTIHGAGKPGPKADVSHEEFMLRVSWSTNKHPDQELTETAHTVTGGQIKHCRRNEVMFDLGLPFAPGDDFTFAEMQAIAFAAKMAALKILRLRTAKKRTRKS